MQKRLGVYFRRYQFRTGNVGFALKLPIALGGLLESPGKMMYNIYLKAHGYT